MNDKKLWALFVQAKEDARHHTFYARVAASYSTDHDIVEDYANFALDYGIIAARASYIGDVDYESKGKLAEFLKQLNKVRDIAQQIERKQRMSIFKALTNE